MSRMTLPIGPQHPLLKEPLSFLLTVEGERIMDSTLRMGYVHRGIERLCQEPVSAEELADNQAFITGSLPLALETNEGVARSIIRMERYKLGLDYLQRYADLINEVTPERVQAVAQRWLDPDAYALAIAGPEVT